jgi:hypothetical protein
MKILITKVHKENGEMHPTKIQPYEIELSKLEAERERLAKRYGQDVYFTYHDKMKWKR